MRRHGFQSLGVAVMSSGQYGAPEHRRPSRKPTSIAAVTAAAAACTRCRRAPQLLDETLEDAGKRPASTGGVRHMRPDMAVRNVDEAYNGRDVGLHCIALQATYISVVPSPGLDAIVTYVCVCEAGSGQRDGKTIKGWRRRFKAMMLPSHGPSECW